MKKLLLSLLVVSGVSMVVHSAPISYTHTGSTPTLTSPWTFRSSVTIPSLVTSGLLTATTIQAFQVNTTSMGVTYVRWADGTVSTTAVTGNGGSGDITSVHGGFGLNGGADSGAVTLTAVSTTAFTNTNQTWTAPQTWSSSGTFGTVGASTVNISSKVVWADGTISTTAVTGGGGGSGDITGVAVGGEGLTGGGTSGDVTVTIVSTVSYTTKNETITAPKTHTSSITLTSADLNLVQNGGTFIRTKTTSATPVVVMQEYANSADAAAAYFGYYNFNQASPPVMNGGLGIQDATGGTTSTSADLYRFEVGGDNRIAILKGGLALFTTGYTQFFDTGNTKYVRFRSSDTIAHTQDYILMGTTNTVASGGEPALKLLGVDSNGLAHMGWGTDANDGGGGGGIVSPGTFTWTNTFGISVSTLVATSTGTTPVVQVIANGTYGATAGSSGGLLVNCTGGGPLSGMCSQFYSNAGAQAATGPLIYVRADNTAFNQPLLYLVQDGTSGGAANIRMDGPAPQIEFVENDQSTPAGKYEIGVNGDLFYISGRNTADSSFEDIFKVSRKNSGPYAALFSTGSLRFYDADSTNFVALKSSDTVASNVTWTLPPTDGTASQAMTTSGVGNLFFQTIDKTFVGLGNVLNIDQTNADNLTSGTIPGGRYDAGTGLIVSVNEIAVDDAIVPFYSVGAGTPTATCVQGSEFYTNTTDDLIWYCSDTNTWTILKTTFTNSGAGAQIVKAGDPFTARTLVEGSNVTITQNADTITIASSGGGGSTTGLYSSVIDFPAIPDGTCAQSTMTATGITTGKTLALALPSTIEADLIATAYVVAADTVAVRLCNFSGAAVNPAQATFSARDVDSLGYLTGSATINYGDIADGTCASDTITVTGATSGDNVAPGWPAALETGLIGSMYVSASNTVTSRLCNFSGASVNPASATFKAAITK